MGGLYVNCLSLFAFEADWISPDRLIVSEAVYESWISKAIAWVRWIIVSWHWCLRLEVCIFVGLIQWALQQWIGLIWQLCSIFKWCCLVWFMRRLECQSMFQSIFRAWLIVVVHCLFRHGVLDLSTIAWRNSLIILRVHFISYLGSTGILGWLVSQGCRGKSSHLAFASVLTSFLWWNVWIL